MALLEELRPAMVDRAAGQTMVRDVRVSVGRDAFDEQALFIVLVLSDPPAGQETWPVADLRTLRNAVRELLRPRLAELGMPWFVSFEPEHPDVSAADEQPGDGA